MRGLFLESFKSFRHRSQFVVSDKIVAQLTSKKSLLLIGILRNRFHYVNDVSRKSQLCETFQRRAMLLNRKACINMTMGFDVRLIARGETREEICTFRQRAINDRKCSGPDTFERCFSPDHFRLEARGGS